MKPGRELDALIAEKVMGIEVEVYDFASGRQGYFYKGTLAAHIPEYSTSIEAAWEVVEKLTEGDKIYFEVTRYRSYPYEGMRSQGGLDGPPHKQFYRARFSSVEKSGTGDSDTAPHAICLAALKAVE